MDELVNMVVQKTGISQDQAKAAVKVVVDYFKQKLPAPISGQIDALLSGSATGDVGKTLGGLFGGKK
jgi:hypothetical protein